MQLEDKRKRIAEIEAAITNTDLPLATVMELHKEGTALCTEAIAELEGMKRAIAS